MSQKKIQIARIVQGSAIEITATPQEQPEELRITITGEAARIPSTTNSRLNMFPKTGILNSLRESYERVQKGDRVRGLALLRHAAEELKKRRVVVTLNPDHQIRLDALTELWKKARPVRVLLPASKNNRYLVTLHLPESVSRVDSHNLCKPMCDWLEEMGVIENDKYVDCFPTRNVDFTDEAKTEELVIAIKPYSKVKTECAILRKKMLE